MQLLASCMSQVFDRDKGLKASMCLAQPVLAACYLDDQGTLLASIGKRLVSIAPAKYSGKGGCVKLCNSID